jgi:ABC-type Fe3+/spermidine/putrescine transport system ATPase subunit
MTTAIPVPTGVATDTVLELRNVVKQYGMVRAVDDLSFTIQRGEVFTLLGPSGCGKSTTLRIVAGLEHPEEGELFLTGKTIVSARKGLYLPPERRNMGMVFQSYAIWPHFTVFENIAFPLRLRKMTSGELRRRVEEALDIVGLAGLGERPATALSGGQQQRVALARALVYRPDILLLDEPLSNLDAKLREHMRLELRSIQRRLGMTVLFVTHDQAEAMTMSDRVAVMNSGHFEQVGAPSEVYERPSSTFVRDFLGRALVLEGVGRRESGRLHVSLTGEQNRTLIMDDNDLVINGDAVPIAVSCRPEDVRLEAVGESAPNRLVATVEEAAYLGERVEYNVRTSSGRSLFVFSSRRQQFPIGAQVDLVIDTTGASVWPQ